jgi:CBS domain-containing protein
MSQISDIMTTEVVTVTPDTSIFDAIEILVTNNFTGLPVVDSGNRPLGVVTEKDLLRLTYELEQHPSESNNTKTVEDVMTRDIAFFDVDDPLDDLYKCLMDGRFRRAPILSNGKLVGLVSRSDLMVYKLDKYIADALTGE